MTFSEGVKLMPETLNASKVLIFMAILRALTF